MDLSHVRRGVFAATTALAVGLTGCGGDSPTDTGGGGGGGGGGGPTMTTSVTVRDNFFTPNSIQVSPGATVTWTWSSTNNGHNVTFANPNIPSSTTQPSGNYQVAMPSTPGTYAYECTIHAGMDGSVLVQ